ncbi:HAMP domain-containing protein [Aliivibrio fischeri]|uniref:sensor histidine kinase n=1 Tax=Aliivibrio fischeri TaxID=668 RepID=UPI0012D8F948|nr:sensor histidine kinase [Aliivibrio fischeri]MUK62191.1 HAMP domain-containing protein [Aliivibrio fischeri]MUK70898.1 HAMP domain-containing protein [Aliivibrio fischeri]MUK74823.1 HAMP domain-containing protein [Aliivibrio fischeri]MUK75935.1 HAMP domain-containing protein [Aliivibrio fischeri]MUL21539.1 HAMP domain-containing protein [Aliivibrio fischeri]
MTLLRWFESCPSFICKYKNGLAFRLFSAFAVSLFLIISLQSLAEIALMKSMLRIPSSIQTKMLDLAEQANILIEEGDMDELADWASAQEYYLFVLDQNNRPITHRDMHPHFEFKLKFLRPLNTQLDNEVNQPIIGIPLENGLTIVIQMPYQYHPANNFPLYFGIIKLVISVLILGLFSWVIARYLQRPLDKLREVSHKLAQGDFDVKVSDEIGNSVREFSELAHDFDNMTHEIHSLAEKQQRLIRDVSHELRTPLARHNLALHLLKKKVDPDYIHLVNRLENESNEMNDLVGEILEFSRLENSRYNTKLELVLLESCISAQVIQSRMDLGPTQCLDFICSKEAPVVHAEPRLVTRVVKNLITNAIKYAGDNALIQVVITEYRSNEKNHVAIIVEDNGPGIPEDQLLNIFSPFTRLESARDKQSGGYGLGLAIVKESMSVMKGQVVAENRKQGGLRVSLLFPV